MKLIKSIIPIYPSWSLPMWRMYDSSWSPHHLCTHCSSTFLFWNRTLVYLQNIWDTLEFFLTRYHQQLCKLNRLCFLTLIAGFCVKCLSALGLSNSKGVSFLTGIFGTRQECSLWVQRLVMLFLELLKPRWLLEIWERQIFLVHFF